MTQEQITQDFSVPEPARLIVENIRGSVDIQSVDESSISGDLSLSLAYSVPSILPDEIEPDAQEKRIKLLERIDKGELSVGEALQELLA